MNNHGGVLPPGGFKNHLGEKGVLEVSLVPPLFGGPAPPGAPPPGAFPLWPFPQEMGGFPPFPPFPGPKTGPRPPPGGNPPGFFPRPPPGPGPLLEPPRPHRHHDGQSAPDRAKGAPQKRGAPSQIPKPGPPIFKFPGAPHPTLWASLFKFPKGGTPRGQNPRGGVAKTMAPGPPIAVRQGGGGPKFPPDSSPKNFGGGCQKFLGGV